MLTSSRKQTLTVLSCLLFLLTAVSVDAVDAACKTRGERVRVTESCCTWLEPHGVGSDRTCQPCGGAGESPCGINCRPGLEIFGTTCRPCGASGQFPCVAGGCNAGLMTGTDGKCQPCGAEGQVPCAKGGCESGLMVGTDGACHRCGGDGQIPCASGGCG
ncbi:MAG TPA: hypothetical protein VNI57_03170, partial [Candidatus Saccharimonadales bacterium]|nr:hypothetical protein [Candidatus Saccharimonadales bacterium]